MARSMLGHNLDSIQPDGTILPAPGEEPRPDEPGHVAYALEHDGELSAAVEASGPRVLLRRLARLLRREVRP